MVTIIYLYVHRSSHIWFPKKKNHPCVGENKIWNRSYSHDIQNPSSHLYKSLTKKIYTFNWLWSVKHISTLELWFAWTCKLTTIINFTNNNWIKSLKNIIRMSIVHNRWSNKAFDSKEKTHVSQSILKGPWLTLLSLILLSLLA